MARGTIAVKVPGIPVEMVLGEHVHDREFSTSRLAATQSTQVSILAAAQGETIPGGTTTLTIRESTIPAGGQRGFPVGYEMFVYSIQLVFGSGTGVRYNNAVPAASAPSDGEMIQVYARTLFNFLVQNKSRSHGPVYKYPSGGGLYLTGNDTSNATNRLWANNGRPSPRDQAAFLLPHHLETDVPFRGTLDFDAALVLSQTLDVEGHIEGICRRPVQ